MNHDDSESLFNPVVAPSGMFSCNVEPYSVFETRAQSNAEASQANQPSHDRSSYMYNPFPLAVERNIIAEESAQHLDTFRKETAEAKALRVVSRSDVEDYALTLYADLAPSLLSCEDNLLLFPLRGVRQPGVLAKVILGIPNEKLVIFNYTYGVREDRQDAIHMELWPQFVSKLPEKREVRIGVLDTAKGGYGSTNLARLLRLLHDEHWAIQRWHVTFHLIHERARRPEGSNLIPRHSAADIEFDSPHLHPVESLIVEDWPDGIGLEVTGEERNELKKCAKSGMVILRNNDSIQLLESNNLCDWITSMVIDPINDLMLNDADMKFVRDVLDEKSEG